MSVSGFTLLYAGPPEGVREPWHIISIHQGFDTDYSLHVRIEDPAGEQEAIFPAPLAYRVHEERDLLHYWYARDAEGVPAGWAYTLAQSPYRDEFARTVSGQEYAFEHYLIVGADLCVEVLTGVPPRFPATWRLP